MNDEVLAGSQVERDDLSGETEAGGNGTQAPDPEEAASYLENALATYQEAQAALDRGLMAGLVRGGELKFRQRITEGADSCRACLEGVRCA